MTDTMTLKQYNYLLDLGAKKEDLKDLSKIEASKLITRYLKIRKDLKNGVITGDRVEAEEKADTTINEIEDLEPLKAENSADLKEDDKTIIEDKKEENKVVCEEAEIDRSVKVKTSLIEKIYNDLSVITGGFKCADINIIKLMELKQLLETEILASKPTKTSDKSRVKFCLNYLNKGKLFERKPILSSCDYTQFKDSKNNPMQVITDSFMAVVLSTEDYINGVKDCKELEGNYPYMKSVMDARYNCKKEFTFNVNELLKRFKLITTDKKTKNSYIEYKVVVIKLEDNTLIALGETTFKNFINFMNIDKADNITLKMQDPKRPLFVVKDNESFGCILPCYVDTDTVDMDKVIDIKDLQA